MSANLLDKGTMVSGYEITGTLGHGGMGVVYEANQVALDRKVALKVLAPHLSDDVVFRERFRREGQLQAGIDHPHIVTVYEAGDSDQGVFIAMRLIRGPNLKDMIVSRELDPGRTIRILTPIGEALDAAHEAGLIHRDIKPQNILVAGRDHAFLADFGLTKAAGEKSLTRTGQFVGTFDYISPEQVKGERATHRSDVYALAAVLYECLTGVVPFPKESEAAVLYAQMADPPPKVTDQRPELPLSLDDVIARGMAKDPVERYESCGQLLLETSRTFTQRTRAALTPPGPIEAPQETGIRQPEADVPTRQRTAEETEEVPAAEVSAATSAAAPDLTVPSPAAPTRAVEPPTAVPAPRQTTSAPTTRTTEPDTTPMHPATAAAVAGARARGRAAPALLGAGILIAAIVAGLLVGRSSGGSEEPASAANNVNAAGALELSYPDGWRRADQPPKVPGLELQDPVTVTRQGMPRDTLAAGMTDATGPSLLPTALLRRLDGDPARDDAVRLGDLEAYRYQRLRVEGYDGRLTLYVAPTTAGVATVACAATARNAAAFLPACEDVAGGLDLIRGEAFALGPDDRYLAKLDDVMGRLNRDRIRDARALRSAKTRAAQGRTAGVLGQAYGRARRALRGGSVSPAVSAAANSVRTAVARTQAAYRRLAGAARRGDEGAYGAARTDARAGEAAIKRALREVRAASTG